MITIAPPRIIRADNGGFRVYRSYVEQGDGSQELGVGGRSARPLSPNPQPPTPRFRTLRYGVPPGVAMCRRCGCTTRWGCLPVCSWADRSGRVCTRCVERMAR